MKNKYIKQLDVFRGLAALSVCSIHFTYDSFFNNYFAQGLFVQLFFTLSGFIISYNYFNNLNSLSKFFDFIKKRFKRLYPLHLFFLIIFLFLEVVKYILIIKFDFQANNDSFKDNNLKNFFFNLFFIQHFTTEYSFNSPSWSISVEMMIYILFGMTSIILKKEIYLIWLYVIYIIFFSLFLNSYYGAGLSIFAFYSGFYSFSIGCLFFILLQKTNNLFLSRNYLDLIFYILFLIFLAETFYLDLIKQKHFYSIIFGFIFFYSCFLNEKFFLFKIFFNKIFIFLGKISYSIYMSHLFVFYIFDNFLKHVLKHDVKLDQLNMVLDLSTFEANIYTIMLYIFTILLSKTTYEFIEMRYYKK